MGRKLMFTGWGNLLGPELKPRTYEPPDGFDWTGVVVRHWRVERFAGAGKHNRPVYRCVSRCGVVSLFRREQLAAGATKSCEACRPGCVAPPAARVIGEHERSPHAAAWEGVAVQLDEKTNLKGDGVGNWERHGRDAVLRMIDRTGLGRDFGWKLYVRDCHNRRLKSGESIPPEVRLRGVHDGTQRVELGVRPAGGTYWYEVDLAAGRTDVPWADVRRKIEAAVAVAATPTPEPEPEPEPAKADPPAAAPAKAEAILAGLDIDRLIRMRDGFDSLITVGRDVKECQGIKAEAVAQRDAAAAAAAPLRSAAEAALTVARRAGDAAARARNTADALAAELRKAEEAALLLAGEQSAAEAAWARAEEAWAPARDALAAAEAQVADAERLEQERIRTLAKADDVALLLAALQRIGGPTR